MSKQEFQRSENVADGLTLLDLGKSIIKTIRYKGCFTENYGVKIDNWHSQDHSAYFIDISQDSFWAINLWLQQGTYSFMNKEFEFKDLIQKSFEGNRRLTVSASFEQTFYIDKAFVKVDNSKISILSLRDTFEKTSDRLDEARTSLQKWADSGLFMSVRCLNLSCRSGSSFSREKIIEFQAIFSDINVFEARLICSKCKNKKVRIWPIGCLGMSKHH